MKNKVLRYPREWLGLQPKNRLIEVHHERASWLSNDADTEKVPFLIPFSTRTVWWECEIERECVYSLFLRRCAAIWKPLNTATLTSRELTGTMTLSRRTHVCWEHKRIMSRGGKKNKKKVMYTYLKTAKREKTVQTYCVTLACRKRVGVSDRCVVVTM